MTGLTEPGVTVPGEQPADAPPPRPDDWRLAVWRGFLRTHSHLIKRLEQDLQAQHKIPLGSYDVLVQLAEAPGNRLRMSELAEAVLLSRSGLSRLVDRLQKDGLVLREPDPCDARGLYTVLTDKGRDTLRDASKVHLAGVARLVLDRLGDPELDQLAGLMAKLDPAPALDRAGDCGLG
ncbi:MAG TPA: MarR family transcriptional regulator [Jatrophihabitans sp.]|nr:MarR family transcriptional regulator [Jatrophihabitans sp.]